MEQVERCINVKDYAKALLLSQKAADAGIADAMNNLGWLYMNGWGVAQDYGKAREWYQKAAGGGATDAKQALFWLRLRRFFGR
jgi:TPR repeat protein